MRKIVKYMLARHVESPGLAEDIVNEMIEKGWQPYGSASTVGGYGLCQPMVKYEEVTPEDKEGQKL